ncbi:hypothetical protein HUJ04_011113 [Dendroctonus ponderosae]|nr:hypothetical protein HUJ04_011113 [Dendroctonus ponderosae]
MYKVCTKAEKPDIMGVTETHGPNSGQCKILDHTVYYSGNDNSQHRNGVGIVPHVSNQRIYTWKSQADSAEKTVRNQIDYIAIPNRFKNSIRSAKTYPGANVPSGHIPVVCRFELRLKRIKKAPSKNNINIGKLSDRNIRSQVQESLNNGLKKINSNTSKAQRQEATEGIQIKGEWINNVRYADDTVILANNIVELQGVMERIQKVSADHGLNLNISKTKWMVVSKDQTHNERITLNDQTIERVESYKYLGTLINARWDQATEIRSRIERARASISWTGHITNKEVLQRIGKEREITLTVKKRKLEYLGHIMRHQKYRLLLLIAQGRINSKRGPGRRRHSWLQNLRQWFGLTSMQSRLRIATGSTVLYAPVSPPFCKGLTPLCSCSSLQAEAIGPWLHHSQPNHHSPYLGIDHPERCTPAGGGMVVGPLTCSGGIFGYFGVVLSDPCKLEVAYVLKGKNLYDFIDGTSEEPNREKKAAEWTKWKTLSSQTATILLSSAEKKLHCYVMNCRTPKTIWDKLKELYGTSSSDTVDSAFQEFYDFRIKDGQAVAPQIEQFKLICRKLEDAGEKRSDKDMVSRLFNGLPQRFSAFLMAWECTPKSEKTNDVLLVRLIREDKRLCEAESTEAVKW